MSVMLSNVVAIVALVVIVGSACLYIYKEKKKGVRCIGCPSAGSCSKNKCAHASEPEFANDAEREAYRFGADRLHLKESEV